jgi:hypothetical protein
MEALKESQSFQLNSKISCFYDEKEDVIVFTKPNIFENLTFSFGLFILSSFGLLLVYLQSKREYKFKEPGISNKSKKKRVFTKKAKFQ